MEKITSNTKMIELTGEEIQVHFSSAFPYFWVRNDGSGTVLMSVSPNISEGKDGVIEVLAGSSAGTMHGYNATCNDLYILGSGKVQVMGTYTPENPFRKARKGGDGNNGQILLNMPLTTDLSDISGFNHVATYTGDTPLTITDDGVFLYKNKISIKSVVDNIPRFTIELDLKANQTGVNSSNAYSRQVIGLDGVDDGHEYGTFLTVALRSSQNPTTLNFYAFNTSAAKGGIYYTSKNYADGKHHHIVVQYDSIANIIYATVDDGDTIVMAFAKNIPTYVSLGRADQYGLNGYIKNLIIKTE